MMMFGLSSSTPHDTTLICPSANPRLRRVLNEHTRAASAARVERLSWLFWLLQVRQPTQLLLDGQLDPMDTLVAAAALSQGGSGRIRHVAKTPSQETSVLLQAASLEWVCSHCAVERKAVAAADALLIGSTDQSAIQSIGQWIPQLRAGALIIATEPALNRTRTQAICRQLTECHPGLENLILAPRTMPLLTMIWRGH